MHRMLVRAIQSLKPSLTRHLALPPRPPLRSLPLVPLLVSQIPTTQTILANPSSNASSSPSQGLTSLLTAPLTTTTTTGSSHNPSPLPLRTLDIDSMISRLLEAGYTGKVTKTVTLKNAEITAICLAAREVFLSQPTLIELSPPVKIVGDVHGQYSDLIRMFEMCGFPPSANFLFLGDYVDRGKQSLETILLVRRVELFHLVNLSNSLLTLLFSSL